VAEFRFKLDERTGIRVGRPPIGARMLGPSDASMRAEIRFQPEEHGGTFHVRTKQLPDAAFRIQADVGRAGNLILQTCLLRPREKPYDLALELARHRVKTYIQKCEDWLMFNPGLAPSAAEHFECARGAFTDALVAPDLNAEGLLAAKAIDLGMQATDELAMAHADILLHRRYGRKTASSTTLGTIIDPRTDPKKIGPTLEAFDLVTVPMRWRDIESKRGKYDFSTSDRWMTWAQENGKPTIAGPIVDFSPGALPDWAEVYRFDYASLRDPLYDYLEQVVARYVKHVGMWKISAGMHLCRGGPRPISEVIDATRTAELLIRRHKKTARRMIEVHDLFGDTTARVNGSIGAFEFLERLGAEGLRFDSIGARLIVGGTEPGTRSRDLMTLSDTLDRFFGDEHPLLLSACGAPCRNLGVGAGNWGEAWTPDRQASWAAKVIPMALSKPYVEAICWSAHTDNATPDPGGEAGFGIVEEDGTPRPAYERLVSMRRRLRRPLGPWVPPGGHAPARPHEGHELHGSHKSKESDVSDVSDGSNASDASDG
jgi:hypothetical protein